MTDSAGYQIREFIDKHAYAVFALEYLFQASRFKLVHLFVVSRKYAVFLAI